MLTQTCFELTLFKANRKNARLVVSNRSAGQPLLSGSIEKRSTPLPRLYCPKFSLSPKGSAYVANEPLCAFKISALFDAILEEAGNSFFEPRFGTGCRTTIVFLSVVSTLEYSAGARNAPKASVAYHLRSVKRYLTGDLMDNPLANQPASRQAGRPLARSLGQSAQHLEMSRGYIYVSARNPFAEILHFAKNDRRDATLRPPIVVLIIPRHLSAS